MYNLPIDCCFIKNENESENYDYDITINNHYKINFCSSFINKYNLSINKSIILDYDKDHQVISFKFCIEKKKDITLKSSTNNNVVSINTISWNKTKTYCTIQSISFLKKIGLYPYRRLLFQALVGCENEFFIDLYDTGLIKEIKNESIIY